MRRAFTTAFLGILAAGGVAHAGGSVTIKSQIEQTDPPPADDPSKPPQYPTLKMKIGAAAQGLKASDFTIKVPEKDPPTTIAANKVEAFNASNEELDLLILVQGNVRFMGNPNPEPEAPGVEPTPIPGDFEQVKQAIDIISKVPHKNTKMGLMVYHEKAELKVPMGDPGAVTGDALGIQRDFALHSTMALRVGLQNAKTILSQMAGRRVLFIIGNGHDQSETYRIDDEFRALESNGIEVYALVADPRPPDPKDMQRMTKLKTLGDVQQAAQSEQVPDVATALANEINNVYNVEFPGQGPDGQLLPWDGNDHDVVIVVRGKEESDARSVHFRDFRPKVTTAPPKKSLLWLWLLLLFVGLGVIAVVAFVLLKKGEEDEGEAPQPQPAPVPQPQPGPAPQPAGPQKTMMIGMGGGDDSMPVVGWIVPINGAAAFKTFKLAQGRTTIGSAPDANVNVSDPYMSTRHAEIMMKPDGFTILDSGSTNGILVNSKKVSSHDLVDNDVFTCGKTDFKFKSIN